MRIDRYLEYAKDVKNALLDGAPVVALESTILSHNLPYPENIEIVKKVGEVIRSRGAVPATIAIINGRIKIGLSKEELEFLGKSSEIKKASRRDIPMILAREEHGATTVAATMVLADLAKIKVFVTGAIGGVHCGAETTFDVSADLEELSRTNVAVVCAGVKPTQDIGRTLEVLESKGVPVIGYGTGRFPAFYTATSGYGVNTFVEDEKELALAIKFKWALGLKGGVVAANPIPKEDALDQAVIDRSIEEGFLEGKKENIQGKAWTAYLHNRIKSNVGEAWIKSNGSLLYNNAKVGADLSKELNAILYR